MGNNDNKIVMMDTLEIGEIHQVRITKRTVYGIAASSYGIFSAP